MIKDWSEFLRALIQDAETDGMKFYISRDCDLDCFCVSFRVFVDGTDDDPILWKIDKEL